MNWVSCWFSFDKNTKLIIISQMSSLGRKFKVLVGLEEDRPQTFLEKVENTCGMSLKTRVIAFGISALISAILIAASIGFIYISQVIAFALFFTAGNLAMIASTLFIVGPLKQLKSLLNPVRLISAIVYFLAMALTLVAALKLRSLALTILAVIIQICALVVYVVSHIPYAQQCIVGLVRGSGAV